MRDSFVVALKDTPEIWEISTAPGTESFPLRRIALTTPLDDFFFDPSYRHLLGAHQDGNRAIVVDLDLGREVATLPLAGMPHLGSGISWMRDGHLVMATPHLKDGKISVIDTTNWKIIAEIPTPGPGYFLRSHDNTPCAWADSLLSPQHRDEISIIDKQSLNVVRTLTPAPGKMTAHVEFYCSGKHALVSVMEKNGALIVYDAATFQEIKRLPMSKPIGKYNVYNKITFSEGTSHRTRRSVVARRAPGEFHDFRDILDVDVVARDRHAEAAKAGERAGKAFRLHAETIGDQRLLVRQSDIGRAGGDGDLIEQEGGDLLRRGLRLELLDLFDELSQMHGSRGQHVESELGLFQNGLAQDSPLDAQDARRRNRLGRGRITSAEEHGGFGESLASGEDLDDNLAAVLAFTKQLHPTFADEEEGVRRIVLLKDALAAFIGAGKAISDQGARDFNPHRLKQRRAAQDLQIVDRHVLLRCWTVLLRSVRQRL